MDWTDDVAAVPRACEESTRERDIGGLRAILREGAVMSGQFGPSLLVGGSEPSHEGPGGPKAGWGHVPRITAVEVFVATARGRPGEEGPFAASFVSGFHLARGEDGRRIVPNALHRDPPEGSCSIR